MSDPEKVGEQSVHQLNCAQAINQVHAFFHGELTEEEADDVRQHLMACESCMDNFDVEAVIASLLKRCIRKTHAPAHLRTRISTMHVRWELK